MKSVQISVQQVEIKYIAKDELPFQHIFHTFFWYKDWLLCYSNEYWFQVVAKDHQKVQIRPVNTWSLVSKIHTLT